MTPDGPGAAPLGGGVDAAHDVGVDVVTVAYNSRDELRACVEPLACLPHVSVTVVDNASPDDSAAVVADLPVRTIRAPRNGGFAYGCNLGVAVGSADFVLLLNPDARIDARNLATLTDALRADPELAAVGPRILDEDSRLHRSQHRFPTLRSTYAQALSLHRLLPSARWADTTVTDPEAYARPTAPDGLSGACVLLRRAALEEVDGLDEGFFLYSEETDLFRRLRDRGWCARFEPRATAHHSGYGSAPRETTPPLLAQSRVRYARKHHGEFVAALEALGVMLDGLARAAAAIRRPARRRGELAAARAALRALGSAGRPR